MRRGDIYWCDLEPSRGHEQGSRRPVIIISADQYNESRSPLAGVIPLTTAVRKHPLHVGLAPSETGLKGPSSALVDHLRFVDRERLSEKPIGHARDAAMARIEQNLVRVLDLRGPYAALQ